MRWGRSLLKGAGLGVLAVLVCALPARAGLTTAPARAAIGGNVAMARPMLLAEDPVDSPSPDPSPSDSPSPAPSPTPDAGSTTKAPTHQPPPPTHGTTKPQVKINVTATNASLGDQYWTGKNTTSFTVTAKNTAAVTESVAIRYTLPTGVSHAPGSACTSGCTLQVSPGQSKSVQIGIVVAADAWQSAPLGGTVSFTASATGATSRSGSTNWGVVFPPGPPSPGVKLAATDVTLDPKPGTPAQLHLEITNTGKVPAAGKVTVSLPAGVTASDLANGCQQTDATTATCTTAVLGVGQQWTISLTLAVPADDWVNLPLVGLVRASLTPSGQKAAETQASYQILAPVGQGGVTVDGPQTPAPTKPATTPQHHSAFSRPIVFWPIIGLSVLLLAAVAVGIVLTLRRRRTESGPKPGRTTVPARAHQARNLEPAEATAVISAGPVDRTPSPQGPIDWDWTQASPDSAPPRAGRLARTGTHAAYSAGHAAEDESGDETTTFAGAPDNDWVTRDEPGDRRDAYQQPDEEPFADREWATDGEGNGSVAGRDRDADGARVPADAWAAVGDPEPADDPEPAGDRATHRADGEADGDWVAHRSGDSWSTADDQDSTSAWAAGAATGLLAIGGTGLPGQAPPPPLAGGAAGGAALAGGWSAELAARGGAGRDRADSEWSGFEPARPKQLGPGQAGHAAIESGDDDRTSDTRNSDTQTSDTQTSDTQTSDTQTGYGEAGYDRAGYDRAGYDRAGYGQGEYRQGEYGQGEYGQGEYGQSGYDRGGYHRNGQDRGGHAAAEPDRDEQAGYDRGDYDATGYDEPRYDQVGYAAAGASGFGRLWPAAGTSGFDPAGGTDGRETNDSQTANDSQGTNDSQGSDNGQGAVDGRGAGFEQSGDAPAGPLGQQPTGFDPAGYDQPGYHRAAGQPISGDAGPDGPHERTAALGTGLATAGQPVAGGFVAGAPASGGFMAGAPASGGFLGDAPGSDDFMAGEADGDVEPAARFDTNGEWPTHGEWAASGRWTNGDERAPGAEWAGSDKWGAEAETEPAGPAGDEQSRVPEPRHDTGDYFGGTDAVGGAAPAAQPVPGGNGPDGNGWSAAGRTGSHAAQTPDSRSNDSRSSDFRSSDFRSSDSRPSDSRSDDSQANDARPTGSWTAADDQAADGEWAGLPAPRS